MALKFLNKKGWHTGSLRNIENVWKAEQKHDAEQKKLEELRKQIQEERERSEFRLLQEQAGLVPKQERLEFLYDSGLAVGKGSSDGFKALESFPKTDPEIASSSSTKHQPSVPGALFEEKAQSANDAWRKLHSDPLLLIRQREQEALARVKNNPIQMAMIRKTVEAKKQKQKTSDGKECQKKRHKKDSKHSSSRHHFGSEKVVEGNEKGKTSKDTKYDDHLGKAAPSSDDEWSRKRLKFKKQSPARSGVSDSMTEKSGHSGIKRNRDKSQREKHHFESRMDTGFSRKGMENKNIFSEGHSNRPDVVSRPESHFKRRSNTIRLSEEERAARLREMQVDAELHEEQRWKRLKKADDNDAREAVQGHTSSGRNFLDVVQRSVYGAEKGGSSTVEESVRRRTHYSQGRSHVSEGNAFRR